jgi:RND family efflux transporter MFP subunit
MVREKEAGMRLRKKIIKIGLPFVILAAGIGGMRYMQISKKSPQKEVPLKPGAIVKTVTLKKEDRDVNVSATGTVRPFKISSIASQVSGTVVYVAPEFNEGGFFKKGALFFKIDPQDYELAIEKAKAAVLKAQYQLTVAESEAKNAIDEWEHAGLETKKEPDPLVLHVPQVKNAKASLAAAKADLEKCRLDLERTQVVAPFNCRISSENIDEGTFVAAGKSVATVAGTDCAEVVVPVSLYDLEWIYVPGPFDRNKDAASSAVVKFMEGNRTFEYLGTVDRRIGETDQKGRMARLVIRVNDPYRLKKGFTPESCLAAGMFVDVVISGKRAEDVAVIPAQALRDNSTVWIINQQNKLEIYNVSLIRRTHDSIYIKTDLEDGEELIVSPLSGAARGMKLRKSTKLEGARLHMQSPC